MLLTHSPTVIAIMLGPRNLLDWQDQMYRGNIKLVFGVLGPSLPRFREGSLYFCVKDVY